ncbi:MAG: TonB-dependent receptor [Capsulimonadaceae bacterium]|nr:TonB-dependent receptor [Capsulimonadaceae bacterium]
MYTRSTTSTLWRCVVTVLCACLVSSPAWSDVFGRLHFSVRDIDTEKPIASAKIVLHDVTNVHPDAPVTAGSDGQATTPPLENHTWSATISANGYKAATVTQSVLADVTTQVDVELEKPEKVIVIKGSVNQTKATNATESTTRTSADLSKYPSTAGNPQSLPSFVTTNPGFVQSSVNVVHPRGEHASTTFNVGGVEIPGALQGRAGQLFSPEILQSVDIQTGGYAPEYGSETAAILNGSLRSGPVKPFLDLTEQVGSFSTAYGELTMGGQLGSPLETVESGPVPRRFRYFLDMSDRTTANSVEPPQPDNQTAHNAGNSATVFGNFDYVLDAKNTLNLFVNTSPASTEIANRAGLPSFLEPSGQGYGYGGFRDADGTVATNAVVNPDPNALGAQAEKLASQQSAGQDITQDDSNTFVFGTLRHEFGTKTSGLLSGGMSRSGIKITAKNGAASDLSTDPSDPNALPVDSAIEYVPNVNRSYTQTQLQGSITQSENRHTYKTGFVADRQVGDESFQFTPGSQLALDALASAAPQLLPSDSSVSSTSTDVYGNPVVTTHSDSVAPTLSIHKQGYYGAVYAQDAWKMTSKLAVNYGLRVDSYQQRYDVSDGSTTGINSTELSPRLNMAYAFVPTTVLRLSYNRLVSQPPLAQTATLGSDALKPQKTDQYDASIERQFKTDQTVKLAYYYKNIRNEFDTGILIPNTQIGVYTTFQYQYASVHGAELSYTLSPHNNVGWGAYTAYSYSTAKPGGLDQSGNPAPIWNDHDQRNTLSAGANYTWASQAQAALLGYYGSGETTSQLTDLNRHPRKYYNARLESSPKMLGFGSMRLDVENIFDERDVINYNSGYSGTRFQQGRTVLVSVTEHF